MTVDLIGMQVLSMCAWVAVLYFGYFYIQSTEWGDLYTPFLLNGLNSTVQQHGRTAPLGSAPARPLHLPGARLAALG